MAKHYKEKHLQATKYRIEGVKIGQDFLLKNLKKVIGFGVLFSFLGPFYVAERSNEDYTYLQLLVMCSVVYLVLCFLYHFSSKFQDKKRLNKLLKLKLKLEGEIKGLE